MGNENQIIISVDEIESLQNASNYRYLKKIRWIIPLLGLFSGLLFMLIPPIYLVDRRIVLITYCIVGAFFYFYVSYLALIAKSIYYITIFYIFVEFLQDWIMKLSNTYIDNFYFQEVLVSTILFAIILIVIIVSVDKTIFNIKKYFWYKKNKLISPQLELLIDIDKIVNFIKKNQYSSLPNLIKFNSNNLTWYGLSSKNIFVFTNMFGTDCIISTKDKLKLKLLRETLITKNLKICMEFDDRIMNAVFTKREYQRLIKLNEVNSQIGIE